MGEARGEARGIERGRIDQLRRLLEHRFGPLPTWASLELGKAHSAQIDTWTFRVFDAAKLEDVFR